MTDMAQVSIEPGAVTWVTDYYPFDGHWIEADRIAEFIETKVHDLAALLQWADDGGPTP